MNSLRFQIVSKICQEAVDKNQGVNAANVKLINEFLNEQNYEFKKFESEVLDLRKKKDGKDLRRFEFDTLLKEAHKADDLVENHSRVSLGVSSALLAFAVSPLMDWLWPVAIFGIIVAVIWLLKNERYKKIFDSCTKRLKRLQRPACLNIDALRPPPECFVLNGFVLSRILIAVVALIWIVLGCWEGFFHLKWVSTHPKMYVSEIESISNSIYTIEDRLSTTVTTHEINSQTERLDNLIKNLSNIVSKIDIINQQFIRNQNINIEMLKTQKSIDQELKIIKECSLLPDTNVKN